LLLQAFRRGEELTPLDSLSRYGVMALSQRVGELKREGVPIHTEMVDLPSGKRVAKYRLVGQMELV